MQRPHHHTWRYQLVSMALRHRHHLHAMGCLLLVGVPGLALMGKLTNRGVADWGQVDLCGAHLLGFLMSMG
jgi:hypothetical protein